MIQFVNCIGKDSARAEFDARIAPRLAGLANAPFAVAHLVGGGPMPSPDRASHLVLSGSELSAARPGPRDGELIETIRAFAAAGRPVLGICYGHQMVARAFGGTCRRANAPELGWRLIDIARSPLFDGIETLVSAHSHYDEVTDLPDDLEVIGSTPGCAVQAFHCRGRPVFGVQFHPEATFSIGERMFAENLESDPSFADHFENELPSPDALAGNDRLFENFFGVLT